MKDIDFLRAEIDRQIYEKEKEEIDYIKKDMEKTIDEIAMIISETISCISYSKYELKMFRDIIDSAASSFLANQNPYQEIKTIKCLKERTLKMIKEATER